MATNPSYAWKQVTPELMIPLLQTYAQKQNVTLKLSELKTILRATGLPQKGNKAVIIERLVRFAEANKARFPSRTPPNTVTTAAPSSAPNLAPVISMEGSPVERQAWTDGPSFQTLFSVYYYDINPEKVRDVVSLITHYTAEYKQEGMARMQTDMTEKYIKSPKEIYQMFFNQVKTKLQCTPSPNAVLEHAKQLADAKILKERKERELKQQQQKILKQEQEKKRLAELHAPGPLVRTALQRDSIRQIMEYAIHTTDSSIHSGREFKSIASRNQIENTMHDGINQYVRFVLHRLVRDHKYKLRSKEKKSLSGLVVRTSHAATYQMLHEDNVKEKHQRTQEEFRAIVEQYDSNDEVIQQWKRLRKRKPDTYQASEEKTLDEQALELLKATVCGDTVGRRYPMLNQYAASNSDSDSDLTGSTIGIAGMQRLVNEQRRRRHGSSSSSSSSNNNNSNSNNKRKRDEAKEHNDATNNSASATNDNIRLTFSNNLRALTFENCSILLDSVKKRMRTQ